MRASWFALVEHLGLTSYVYGISYGTPLATIVANRLEQRVCLCRAGSCSKVCSERLTPDRPTDDSAFQ